MRLVPILALALATTSTLALVASDAEACSPAQCWSGSFTPRNGATIPANTPALHWDPIHAFDTTQQAADPANITLNTSTGATVPFTVTADPRGGYLLVLDQPLVAGETYELVDANACSQGLTGPRSTFQAGPMAPLPTTLGSLVATAAEIHPLQVWTDGGQCSAQIEADTADVTLQHSADATPWKDMLHYGTEVDGAPWQAYSSSVDLVPLGASWQGYGVDRLYVICATNDEDAFPGVDEGTHQVTMTARIPGTSTMLESAALSVELACDAPDELPNDSDDNDGGCSTTNSGAGLLLGLAALVMRRHRRRAPASEVSESVRRE